MGIRVRHRWGKPKPEREKRGVLPTLRTERVSSYHRKWLFGGAQTQLMVFYQKQQKIQGGKN